MTLRTVTTAVDHDGAIRLPDGAPPAGTIVTVVYDQADAPGRISVRADDEPLTVLTADTPERRARFVRDTCEWGERNRASLPGTGDDPGRGRRPGGADGRAG